MRWRALVLFITAFVMFYLVGLFQDAPYPRPVWLQTTAPSKEAIISTETLLTRTSDYFYQTQIMFDAVLKGNQGSLLGIGSIQLYSNGYITQSRRKTILSKEDDWEFGFSHILPGPITHFSASSNHDDRFAVLYYVVEDEHLHYYARVYYMFEGKTEYKDLHLSGNTIINSFSFEDDTIIYSRDPDQYRFRVIYLPKNLLNTPPTADSKPIDLPPGQPGEPMGDYHQPGEAKNHVGIVSKLYSSRDDIYRVFSLDVHQTKRIFYINSTIVDGITSNEEFIEWKKRDHSDSSHDLFIDITYKCMKHEDGARFHHERIEIQPPPSKITSNGKTIVLPILANSFLTLDYTNNTDRLRSDKTHHRHLYRDTDSTFLNETYFSMTDDLLSTDFVVGLKINQEGTILLVWTQSNTIYIFKRGIDDKYHKGSPYQMDRKLEWILRMMILPIQDQVEMKDLIGNAFFWNESSIDYLSIITKGGTVKTYLVNVARKRKELDFMSFPVLKWDLWIAMTVTIVLFILNEVKNHP